MRKASIGLQELRRKIYSKAKTEKHWRFWGLYCHISKKEVLEEAYRLAKANGGAPGIDGKSFEDIEAEGVKGFLEGIRQELLSRTYRPMTNRRVEIPKEKGKTRVLGIPTVRDRVVQGALKLILEPIFEADFRGCSYGYRPRRHAHQAIDRVTRGILQGLTRVVDVDLSGYLETSSYCTPFHERVSKRVGWIPNTLIYKPFRFPERTWTAESSPRFTRCNTVWRETPRSLVASSIDTWPSGTS
jgi:RNA-directed DNA polymerase